MSDLSRIVGRVAVLLDALNDRPTSVRALAAETGIPRSTTQRLLDALQANCRAELTPRGWTSPSVEVLFAPTTVSKDSLGWPVGRDAFPNRGERWAA